ncbi:MarR family transcriptional regulator [Balneolales bacterium ANBcel1]|nr:MarR family transcriptional regulator [Balneolales bacterium ANBcel1]
MNTFKEEIKQTREFESQEQEAIIALLLTTDRLKGRLSALAGQFEITPQQYNVLRILNGAGDDGIQTLEIMDRMLERNPGITRLLDRLETKALIVRERSASDRRCQICRITAKGKTLLTNMDAPMQDLTQSVMQLLDKKQVTTLIDLLSLIRKGM